MFDSIISLIAPHRCVSCGALGALLCPVCTADLVESRRPMCLLCAGDCNERGLCIVCNKRLPVERALLFGERGGTLEALVNEFKFSCKRAAYRPIAGLLASLLPYRLTHEAVFVPLPTIARHVRERGYDHTALVAKQLVRTTGAVYEPVLARIGRSVQRGATKQDRLTQAEYAFQAKRRPLDPRRLYILVDDIVTTGASVRFASSALRQAGARRIWVLALARQPLDEQG
jgi:ComF family protein